MQENKSGCFFLWTQMCFQNDIDALTFFRAFHRQCLESLLQKDCCQFLAALSAIVVYNMLIE